MAPFSYGDSTAFYATVRSYGQSMASARWCMMCNGITACSCSPRCRARSANHCDYELDQRLLFYLQRRKTKARDLQDPEYSIRYLPRYRGTLEGTVLSSRQRPRRREGVRESISLISGSCLTIRSGKSKALGQDIRCKWRAYRYCSISELFAEGRNT